MLTWVAAIGAFTRAHVVARGDSLSEIAERYGVEIEELRCGERAVSATRHLRRPEFHRPPLDTHDLDATVSLLTASRSYRSPHRQRLGVPPAQSVACHAPPGGDAYYPLMRASLLVALLTIVAYGSACGSAQRSPPEWVRDPSRAESTLTVGQALDACGASEHDFDPVDEPPGLLRAIKLECYEEDVMLELAREPRLFSADRTWPIESVRAQRVVRVGPGRDVGPWTNAIDVIELGPLATVLGVERLPGTLGALRRWAHGRPTTCNDDAVVYFADEWGTRGGHCTVGPIVLGSVTVTIRFELMQLGDREPIATSVELVASDPDALVAEIVRVLGGRLGLRYGLIRVEAGSVRITAGRSG